MGMIWFGEACLVVICLVLELRNMRDHREWAKERENLVNRLMSRDFTEYAYGTRAMGEQVEAQGVPSEEPDDNLLEVG